MEVILLERIARLGQMGDTVRVKDGFARNFLLPSGRALRANEANRAKFESQKADLVARNEERKQEAFGIAGQLRGRTFVIIRSAGETGQLYGSVSARDITDLLAAEGVKVSRNAAQMKQPIKTIGLHEVTLSLHPDVELEVSFNIARSQDEADRQARGENLNSAAAIYGADEEENYDEEVLDEEEVEGESESN
ncbi:50S ribosomal protein L9 [Aureimonas psammosilenae]|uniref:50S ribosomal protein L9 n=1 Tax=Aureimonas psammosilenae TaxID=2495496 RepID=UPI00126112AC|nr:50S ribosomal protein L9 [Aureimonas psammosilenae]